MTKKITVKNMIKKRSGKGGELMNERKIVSQRIEHLRTKMLYLTQKDFAKFIGLDEKKGRSTVNNWEQGAIQIKSEDIAKIAKECSVSADWLLGLSDTPYRNESIQSIHAQTGLSGNAISKLQLIAKGKDADRFPLLISALIEDTNCEYFLALLESILSHSGEDETITLNIDGKELRLLAQNHLKAVFQSQMMENINSLAKIYKKMEE